MLNAERMKNVMESGKLHKKMIRYRKKAMNRMLRKQRFRPSDKDGIECDPNKLKCQEKETRDEKNKRFCTSFELSERKPKSRVEIFSEEKHIEKGIKIEDLDFVTER